MFSRVSSSVWHKLDQAAWTSIYYKEVYYECSIFHVDSGTTGFNLNV